MKYFTIFIPILLIYMAKYHTLMHDYKHLEFLYSNMKKKNDEQLIEKREKNG